jgi:hypothetical protein
LEQKYTLTEAEYIHQAMYISQRLPANRRRRVFLIVMLAVVAAIAAGTMAGSLVWAFIGAALGALYGAYSHRVSSRTQLAQLYKVIHREELFTVDLTEGGLYIALEHIRSQIDWEALTAIEEDAVGFYFIYGPLNSVFVPRRVFATAGDAQRFWAQAQESWQFARPTPNAATAARV